MAAITGVPHGSWLEFVATCTRCHCTCSACPCRCGCSPRLGTSLLLACLAGAGLLLSRTLLTIRAGAPFAPSNPRWLRLIGLLGIVGGLGGRALDALAWFARLDAAERSRPARRHLGQPEPRLGGHRAGLVGHALDLATRPPPPTASIGFSNSRPAFSGRTKSPATTTSPAGRVSPRRGTSREGNAHSIRRLEQHVDASSNSYPVVPERVNRTRNIDVSGRTRARQCGPTAQAVRR